MIARRLWALPAAVVLAAATWQTRSLLATTSTDPSWEAALHLTWTQGVHFGSGFAWTYGPLGFLSFPIAVSSGTLFASFVFVALAQVALAYLLLRHSVGAFGIVGVVVAYFALALPAAPPDFLLLIELLLVAAALDDARAARWFPWVGGVVAGLASLTKTNTGAVAVGIAVVTCVALALDRDRRALAGLGVMAVTFLAGWAATGSPVAGIPQWLRLSASLVSGYPAAMELEQPGLRHDYTYAAALLAMLVVAALLRARSLGRVRGAALVLCVLAFGYAFFKEGFVRHDLTHSTWFFAAAGIGCVAAAGRDLSRVAALGGVAVAFFALQGNGELNYAPVNSARYAWHEAGAVIHDRGTLVDESRQGQQDAYQVPAQLLAELRGHTTHVDPFETALVSGYGLRWRPLPVVQGYSAYTSELDEHDARFMASAHAPQRVLRENTLATVSGRTRELEAPAEFRAFICNYRQLGVSERWQVLAHTAPRCGPARKLATYLLSSDEAVTVPEARPDELVVARIWTHDTSLNALRSLALKPRVPGISLNGNAFVPFVAATGPDGVVLHVPATAGFDPRFGGAIDWRSIAVGSFGGPVRIEFDAIPVRGRVTVPPGERSAALPARVPALRAGNGGYVDYSYVRGSYLVLQGWAADVSATTPAQRILVTADGKLVFAGSPNVQRPDVARALAAPALVRAGFLILIPQRLVRTPAGTRRHVRVYAIVNGRALALTAFFSYGWR